jgi:hypothetical protein
MELNFCFDVNVEVGMYCHFSPSSGIKTQQIPIANIIGRPDNSEWNKIYINFTDEMRTATASNGMINFDVYMKCGIKEGENAKFLFDNIKIVYR